MRLYQKKEWAVLKNMIKDAGVDKVDYFYANIYKVLCNFIPSWDHRFFDKFLEISDNIFNRDYYDHNITKSYFKKVMEIPYEDLPAHMHDRAPKSKTKFADFIVIWRLRIGK